MNLKYLSITAGVMLLLGIPSWWPYCYYTLLRWAVFFISILVAYGFYNSKLQFWTVVFGIIAILFNPVLPFYLQKSTWVIFDFIAAALFFLAGFSFGKKNYYHG